MNNQKKIEDILHSIQELILEAQNEKKLDKLGTSEVIELNKVSQSKPQNFLKNLNYNQLNNNKSMETREAKPIINNSYLKNSWRDLNFKKCQEKPQSLSFKTTNKENFENKLEKILEDSLSFWIKENLSDMVKEEAALHTKKILEEKLK
ncbi:MAG: hypothetical protein CBC84_003310 [Pelagibacteraceae bacterium TMED124]|nr:hypothetical protein [Rickettsiales bacterium]RPG16344.1 MAG: hypothetical protein CBC84_003310 [Pelagibacteraceae bacterium TMED124]|tara:strand:+ start:2430 stop:2876 length:447 start_codon:yes stop_codon:yes gene_type:complete